MAAEVASADSTPTDGAVPAAAGALVVADAAGWVGLGLLEVDGFDDPQPAAIAATRTEERRIIAGRAMAWIVPKKT